MYLLCSSGITQGLEKKFLRDFVRLCNLGPNLCARLRHEHMMSDMVIGDTSIQ